MVVVPDGDLLKSFMHQTKSVSKPIARLLNFVMSEHERCVAVYKECLPVRSTCADYPQFLWIQPPLHDNFCPEDNSLRYKFNKCLEKATKIHQNVSSLMLKKVWDPANGNLFLEHSQRFTAEGYQSYWEAVDRTVRYFDSIILKKSEKRKAQKMGPRFQQHQSTMCTGNQKDRFRWKNPNLNRSLETHQVFNKLPPPPPHCFTCLFIFTIADIVLYYLLRLFLYLLFVLGVEIFHVKISI